MKEETGKGSKRREAGRVFVVVARRRREGEQKKKKKKREPGSVIRRMNYYFWQFSTNLFVIFLLAHKESYNYNKLACQPRLSEYSLVFLFK